MVAEKKKVLLRERDFFVLLLALIGLYVALDTKEFSYRIEPAWFVDLRESVVRSDWQLPAPRITDLDGDGRKEIVLVTRDFQLKVLDASIPKSQSGEIYTPKTMESVQLPFGDIEMGRSPVLLRTGYTQSYSANKQRAQVIVVVHEDGSVSCYSAKLKLLWERQVVSNFDEFREKFVASDVAATVLSLSLDGVAEGVVIVGCSMSMRRGEQHFEVEEGMDTSEDGAREHPEMRAKLRLGHFSISALDATTGAVLWTHDGTDVLPEQYSKSLPLFMAKLSKRDLVAQLHRAPVVPDWTLFRDSLVGELPHDWHGRDDTSLRIAHFSRKHIGAGAASQADRPNKRKRSKGGLLNNVGRFTGMQASPLLASASLPHDASEHTEHPNVLVAHTSKGLEVISLRSGAPIASLALTQGSSYADIDGDGIVDTILVVESSGAAAAQHTFSDDPQSSKHCRVTTPCI